jgi:hypothetical protein
MRSPLQPKIGRNDPYPLPESHMLVLEDTMRRHAELMDGRAPHVQAGVLLLLAACVLLAVLDSLPDRTAAARSPVPTAPATRQHPAGAGADLNAFTTCMRDRVCPEGGS